MRFGLVSGSWWALCAILVINLLFEWRGHWASLHFAVTTRWIGLGISLPPSSYYGDLERYATHAAEGSARAIETLQLLDIGPVSWS